MSLIEYGVHIIQGRFGGGKSYLGSSEVFIAKLRGEKILLISNIPYSFVDIFVDTKQNMQKTLLVITKWIESTNLTYGHGDDTRIVIIIDELHTVFNSRDFDKGEMQQIMILLSQCRKRNISIIGITQYPATIDRVFRLMCDYSIVMMKGFLFTFARYYNNIGDLVDINPELRDENMATEGRMESLAYDRSEIFRPLSWGYDLFVNYYDWYNLLLQEKVVTNYVVGVPSTSSPDIDLDLFLEKYNTIKQGLQFSPRILSDRPHPYLSNLRDSYHDEDLSQSESLQTMSDATSSKRQQMSPRSMRDLTLPSYIRKRSQSELTVSLPPMKTPTGSPRKRVVDKSQSSTIDSQES